MKAKTIKAVIRKKVDDWLASIEDEKLRRDIKNDIIVTGGCIASMLLREKVNDFDIYFRSRDAAHRVAQYYAARFEAKNKNGIKCDIRVEEKEDRIRIIIQSAGIASEEGTPKPYQYFESASIDSAAEGYVGDVMGDPEAIEDTYQATEEAALNTDDDGKPKYRPVFLSTNAITLSGKVQLILRFFGKPDEIHANYDFVHCTNYWESANGGELVLKKEALEALLTKELRYVGSKYPICSLIRVRKFVGRGWCINAGQILKMVMQLSDLNLKDPKVLEDQLTGVDVAYFHEVLHKVHEHDPEKINSAYLIEIIDRMF